MSRFPKYLLLLLLLAADMAVAETLDYEASLTGVAGVGGNGDYAPLYLSAMSHGRRLERNQLQVQAALWHPMDTTRRLAWDYGVTVAGGVASTLDYARYDEAGDLWTSTRTRRPALWLQECYATLKWRCLFLGAGVRQESSPLLTQALTSGDLIRSGNARPMPGWRLGFIDFQDIPFTRGWVQIQGELDYTKYTDSGWWTNAFNHYYGHLTSGQWLVYRRCYFRVAPHKPLSVVVGVQCSSQFGGTTTNWRDGHPVSTERHPARFADFLKMIWPLEDGSEGFIQGNTLGSWDFKATYTLPGGSAGSLAAYFQWPWEDGSGMAKLNGFDGLWGLEWKPGTLTGGWLGGVVLEYLDLTNQSGPMHWDPDDHPGTSLGHRAEGADDYYNNAFYNPYAAWGLAQGSPMVMSPAYNADGYMQFVGNRMRGLHLGASGCLGPRVAWLAKAGWRKAWGNGMVQLPEPLHSCSLLLQAAWSPARVPGLSVTGAFAADSGTMPCSGVALTATVSYRGCFSF